MCVCFFFFFFFPGCVYLCVCVYVCARQFVLYLCFSLEFHGLRFNNFFIFFQKVFKKLDHGLALVEFGVVNCSLALLALGSERSIVACSEMCGMPFGRKIAHFAHQQRAIIPLRIFKKCYF